MHRLDPPLPSYSQTCVLINAFSTGPTCHFSRKRIIYALWYSGPSWIEVKVRKAALEVTFSSALISKLNIPMLPCAPRYKATICNV